MSEIVKQLSSRGSEKRNNGNVKIVRREKLADVCLQFKYHENEGRRLEHILQGDYIQHNTVNNHMKHLFKQQNTNSDKLNMWLACAFNECIQSCLL